MPNTITAIPESAFEWCISLIYVDIPESVREIGDYAFYYCPALSNIIIPKKLDNIVYCSFWDCSKLTFYVYSNSYAEEYAEENDIPFIQIEKLSIADPNNDDFVDVFDLIFLKQAIELGSFNLLSTLDVNGDGKIDVADLIFLKRYIAGWEGYELGKPNQPTITTNDTSVTTTETPPTTSACRCVIRTANHKSLK